MSDIFSVFAVLGDVLDDVPDEAHDEVLDDVVINDVLAESRLAMSASRLHRLHFFFYYLSVLQSCLFGLFKYTSTQMAFKGRRKQKREGVITKQIRQIGKTFR